MGLLSLIESGRINSPSPSLSSEKEGLLTTAETSKLSFFDFVEKYLLSHCAVFTRCDNNFVVSNSIGFDGETIISSVSTNDFWDGSIKKNDWTFFSRTDNSIVTVLQFFSKGLKDKINFVGTYYTSNKILLVAYEKLLYPSQQMNEISALFKTIDFNANNKILDLDNQNTGDSKINLSLDYENAINDFLSKNTQINAKALPFIKKSLRQEFEYKLRLLSNSNVYFVKTGLYNIMCKVYSQSNMSAESLKSFLSLNLKSVLGTSANLISYED